MWSEIARHELHPLNLQPTFRAPSPDGAHLALPIPVFEDESLARFARIAWGRIEDEDRGEYGEAFLLEPHEGDAAHFALVDGQVSGLAPLAQSTYLIEIYFQQSPVHARQLLVLDSDDFTGLLFFWNLRARATKRGEPAVVGIPREALAVPGRLRSLVEWTTSQFEVVKPDVLVHCQPDDHEAARVALGSHGFREAARDARLTEY
jgi:hypothetical protein